MVGMDAQTFPALGVSRARRMSEVPPRPAAKVEPERLRQQSWERHESDQDERFVQRMRQHPRTVVASKDRLRRKPHPRSTVFVGKAINIGLTQKALGFDRRPPWRRSIITSIIIIIVFSTNVKTENSESLKKCRLHANFGRVRIGRGNGVPVRFPTSQSNQVANRRASITAWPESCSVARSDDWPTDGRDISIPPATRWQDGTRISK